MYRSGSNTGRPSANHVGKAHGVKPVLRTKPACEATGGISHPGCTSTSKQFAPASPQISSPVRQRSRFTPGSRQVWVRCDARTAVSCWRRAPTVPRARHYPVLRPSTAAARCPLPASASEPCVWGLHCPLRPARRPPGLRTPCHPRRPLARLAVGSVPRPRIGGWVRLRGCTAAAEDCHAEAGRLLLPRLAWTTPATSPRDSTAANFFGARSCGPDSIHLVERHCRVRSSTYANSARTMMPG